MRYFSLFLFNLLKSNAFLYSNSVKKNVYYGRKKNTNDYDYDYKEPEIGFLYDNKYDNKYEHNIINFKELYKSKSKKQKIYYKDINDDNINVVIACGPAGTGKTLLPTQHIAKLLATTDTKIVLTRPLISVDEELGYLPGNINKKMDPWIIPIFDVLREFFTQKMLNEYISNKQIEIVPLAFMRGRTFKNTFIIGDELQNTSNKQMLMLLTRLGENSKIVITGDISQSDNNENGLLDLLNRFHYKGLNEDELREKSISLIQFDKHDIQRSKIVETILDIYED
tara:strand:+ start:1186 stop:2031 length:846 start_codon:yes stop_codon:yes gene_type:complete